MSWLSELARPEIRALRAYEHAVWEPGLTRLHANELPWRAASDSSQEGLNRYPEPHPHALTAALADFYGVPAAQVLVGRGSDEAIDLLIRSYCRAGQDAVLICPPTFGMYAVAARIQGAHVIEQPLQREADWAPEMAALRSVALSSRELRLIFLCSPNNPTGNRLDGTQILALARALEGRALLVVDEAYVEFAQGPSLLEHVANTPGLVVLRTLSKAHGLAGARCGVAIAQQEIIALLRKVIQPYAITQLTIEAVMAALTPAARSRTAERIATLRAERARLAAGLLATRGVQRVWPSEANFLLVEFADAGEALERTHRAQLLVRDLRGTRGLGEALRISVGSPEQNDQLLASLAGRA
ncbi:MAG TPA: histidinol-phosphate transaminase [Steroidobacteraceae bacterium]|jgi:histidinol-phosphate aminotransferase|nr:histidinol-phosphate transaminase [Steroidobacteraceae bacterium]